MCCRLPGEQYIVTAFQRLVDLCLKPYLKKEDLIYGYFKPWKSILAILISLCILQDHGEISITTDRPLLQNLHPLLSRYVKEFKSLGQVHTDMDGAIISHILDCLRKPNPITLGHQIPVKFYSLSVASAAEDALFNGEESVWKWMKLPSPYGKGMQWSRNWNVMRGAYFNIGKNLSLMVKGVGREEKERLFKDKQTMKYMDNPRARGEKAICEKET